MFFFACSNGVCGYRLNETVLLAFDETIKKVQFYRISMHAPGNGFFLKKGSACFFGGFFCLFSCSSGVCGYRRNETLLLAFDIASDMTKNSCNKNPVSKFLW